MVRSSIVAAARALLIGGAGATALSRSGNAVPLAAATQNGAQTGETNTLMHTVQQREVKRKRSARKGRAARNRSARAGRSARNNRAARSRAVRSNRAARSNRAVRSNRAARSTRALRADRRAERRADRRNWRYNRARHGDRFRSRRGSHRHYYDGWWYASPFWLGVVAAPSYAYGTSYSSAHVEWCYDNYRSYSAQTDSYLGYDGYYHRCDSPYS